MLFPVAVSAQETCCALCVVLGRLAQLGRVRSRRLLRRRRRRPLEEGGQQEQAETRKADILTLKHVTVVGGYSDTLGD